MSTTVRRTTAGLLVAVSATGLVALTAGISEAAVASPHAFKTTAVTSSRSGSTSSKAPLVVRFTHLTTPVPKPSGAKFGGVKVTVTGGGRGVAAAISTAMARHLNVLGDTFAAEAADEAVTGGVPGSSVFDAVQGASARSVHYLSIRLDESVNLGGAHPASIAHAYTFDMATGREVTVATLFKSTAATNRAIRAALVAANRRVGLKPSQATGLSIVPDKNGSTAPLSCYPTNPGLHCVVDPGGVLGYAAGGLESTVPWKALVVAK